MSLGRGVSSQFIHVVKTHKKFLKGVNQYVKLDVIGSGTYGKVFIAYDRTENKHYAMKQIKLQKMYRSPLGLVQLEKEVDAMRKIDSNSIINLKEVIYVKEAETAYIITELVGSGSVQAIMKSRKLSDIQVQYIFAKVAHALSYLHAHRIIHQDIKPGNILVSRSGKVVISDFGICHSFDSVAAVFGTPLYQAPEALDINNDDTNSGGGKEDVWSLGVTLYEMLFGTTPFRGSSIYEIIASIHQTQLEPPSEVDPAIWELILGMLTIDPEARLSIQDVIDNSYVTSSPELIPFPEIPETPIPEFNKDAEVHETEGMICPPGFRFSIESGVVKGDERMMRFRYASSPF